MVFSRGDMPPLRPLPPTHHPSTGFPLKQTESSTTSRRVLCLGHNFPWGGNELIFFLHLFSPSLHPPSGFFQRRVNGEFCSL